MVSMIMVIMPTQAQRKVYNQRAYWKCRQDPKRWAAQLRTARLRYARVGHKKVPSQCLVCGKKWLGIARLRRFCSQKCVSQGQYNGRWKGGRRTNADGYMLVYAPGHPKATRNFILEHRVVMEQHLGRLIKTHEDVHHINGDRADNRMANLQLMSKSEHGALHSRRYWKGLQS